MDLREGSSAYGAETLLFGGELSKYANLTPTLELDGKRNE